MTIEFDDMEFEPATAEHRGSGRRRMVVGVVAAMLVAGAGGLGYGIGRSVDRDAANSSSGDDAAAVAPTSTIEQPVATSDVPGATAEVVEETSEDAAAEYTDTDFGVDIGGSGGFGYSAFGSQPAELLAERVTESGFVLRAQLAQRWDQHEQQDWGAGEWRPAPWCFESGQMRIAITGNGIIDVGGVGWYAEPFEGRAVSSVLLGGSDASPQWVVVVQTPPEITTVRAVFATGAVDEVAPQNGVALLTAPGEAPTEVDEGDYTYWMEPTPDFAVTLEGGAEPVSIGPGSISTWDDPEFRASCQPPPPALPDAGPQPVDPAAAEAEVRAAMESLYGMVGSDGAGADLIDDPTGVAEAREQVQAGGFADDAAGATASIDELVFTAADEAWFRYSIDTPGNDFDNRYGIAVFVDGTWKITRATICQDLSLAGGDCGPGWEAIYPPGFGD
jgi:hypothetical protein